MNGITVRYKDIPRKRSRKESMATDLLPSNFGEGVGMQSLHCLARMIHEGNTRLLDLKKYVVGRKAEFREENH